MASQMLKHIDILYKKYKKYWPRLVFAATFWTVAIWCFSDLYPAAKKAHKLHLLSQAHNESVEVLNQFFQYGRCNLDFPLDYNTYKARHIHQLIGAVSDLTLDEKMFLSGKNIIFMNFTSYYEVDNKKRGKEIFSKGYLYYDRKTRNCFGFLY